MKELHITQSSSSKFFTKLKHSINLKRLLNKNDHFSIKNISLSPLPLEQDRTLRPSEFSPFSTGCLTLHCLSYSSTRDEISLELLYLVPLPPLCSHCSCAYRVVLPACAVTMLYILSSSVFHA